MADDPKVTVLPTGYQPEEAPAGTNELGQLRWDIALLADEIKQLSTTLQKLTRGMQVFHNKLADIHRHIKK